MLRVGLFLLTNLAVILIASITLSIFGVGSYLDESGTGLDFTSLLIFCGVFGFTGSLVSLFISKFIAKKSMRVKIIEQPSNSIEAWLLQTVESQAREAGIGMPEVGIFQANESNAFATGWNKNNALVAVSTGLLERFSQEEAAAVMAHEISHVANGDMVTLALIQGVVNTFVMFFARIIGFMIDRVILRNKRGRGFGFFIATMAAEFILGILASMIVMWFSRRREFRADAGSANLVGNQAMIGALQQLQQEQGLPQTEDGSSLSDSFQAFGIKPGKSLMGLFSSHPPLAERINALSY